jgi:hypothetical protein
MMEDGRPRFWIPWYDRWNLVLPIVFVAAVAWLAFQPRSRVPELSSPPVRPLSPVTLEAPASGARLRMDRMGEVEGRAERGTTVVLFYSQAPSLERRELSGCKWVLMAATGFGWQVFQPAGLFSRLWRIRRTVGLVGRHPSMSGLLTLEVRCGGIRSYRLRAGP